MSDAAVNSPTQGCLVLFHDQLKE